MSQQLRILIVEDNADDAELFLRKLRSGSYELEHERVETAAAMLEALRSRRWDIIVSDYSMPQFSGTAALKLKHEHAPTVPFILISGTIGEELAVESIKAGADDYLLKDNLARLVPAVDRALREAEHRLQRQRAEEALLASEELFRCLSDSSPLGVLLLNDNGHLTYINPRGRAIFGLSLPESAGRGWQQVIHAADREGPLAELLACMQHRREYSGEFRLQSASAEICWVHMRSAPMNTSNGDPHGQVATIEDITTRKRADEALRESNRQLDQTLDQLKAAQKQLVEQERLHALGQMASGIAHDFNNALAPILGFSELLLHRPEKTRDQETLMSFLQMINTSAKDAAHVVRRLREFYRHRERGEVFLPVNVNQLILQTVALTQPRWKEQMQTTGINIDVQTDLAEVPSLYCDESELREMLTNLIFNAVDALPTGGTITVRTRTEADRVLLEISDTGTGMTDEVRQRCLEPFFSTKGERGTGLGLSMVYGVVQRHAGSLDIRSELGKGTTFAIHFPVEAAPQTRLAEPEAEETAQPLHILVVDDERMVLDVLTDYLTGDGHSVATANDGQQALAKFALAKFDLVITDRSMPGYSGEQLAVAIKARQASVPVIMLTGFGMIMDATADCPKGVDYLLSKPITLSELHRAVAQACPGKKKETRF